MKLSVIIPVYNSEKHLSKCIDSVINQSFSNFELLLIDDGSNDKSATICDKYALQDSRIRVFHKNNGGVSSARNFGIEKSQGDYICFVDSDDVVLDGYLEHLMTSNAEFVVTGIILQFPDGGEKVILPENVKYRNVFDVLSYINTKGYIFNGPCQKRYETSIIKRESIRFREDLSYGEDTIFVLQYMFNCTSAETLEFADYVYIKNKVDSLSNNISYETRVDYIFKLVEEINSIIVKSDFSISLSEKKVFSNLIQRQLFATLQLLYVDNEYRFKQRNMLIKQLRIFIQSKCEWYYLARPRYIDFPFFGLLRYKSFFFFDFLSRLITQTRKFKYKIKNRANS